MKKSFIWLLGLGLFLMGALNAFGKVEVKVKLTSWRLNDDDVFQYQITTEKKGVLDIEELGSDKRTKTTSIGLLDQIIKVMYRFKKKEDDSIRTEWKTIERSSEKHKRFRAVFMIKKKKSPSENEKFPYDLDLEIEEWAPAHLRPKSASGADSEDVSKAITSIGFALFMTSK